MFMNIVTAALDPDSPLDMSNDTVGQDLAKLNWREALALRDIVNTHTQLGATIQ
jgi:hypothetical protein